jgi:hypothetical protein
MLEKKLEELRAKREPLFQRFANNPNEVDLAIEIKFIDDQIAECIQLKKKADLGDSWSTKKQRRE